ncbi:MAG TPA: hypothetical protein PKA43_00005 [Candidatus Competibacter phosphatis]|nr:hypothetical protein [Candidatus Competibacter phosphatis]
MAYKILYKFITAERFMRDRVFPAGHAQRAQKLADCDAAMAAANLLKEFCKQHLPAGPIQEVLIDAESGAKKGGY